VRGERPRGRASDDRKRHYERQDESSGLFLFPTAEGRDCNEHALGGTSAVRGIVVAAAQVYCSPQAANPGPRTFSHVARSLVNNFQLAVIIGRREDGGCCEFITDGGDHAGDAMHALYNNVTGIPVYRVVFEHMNVPLETPDIDE
jgi:hypothetical protein